MMQTCTGIDQTQETGEAHAMPQKVIDEVKEEEQKAGDVGGVAGKRLEAFIQRIERLEEEKAALMEDIKEVYAEAKGIGFDVKTMRKIIRLRAMDSEKRNEEQELLQLYAQALGMQHVLPL